MVGMVWAFNSSNTAHHRDVPLFERPCGRTETRSSAPYNLVGNVAFARQRKAFGSGKPGNKGEATWVAAGDVSAEVAFAWRRAE
jgi:hypothetical protein